ncbi:hypothetical protein JL721_3485 [Aureococcus anophagefferens]|nr:hypothetical protein JL721_3485 [Aureococcus anophagefferens]
MEAAAMVGQPPQPRDRRRGAALLAIATLASLGVLTHRSAAAAALRTYVAADAPRTSSSACASSRIRAARGLLANASLPASAALKPAAEVDADETAAAARARTKMALTQRVSFSLEEPCSSPSRSMSYVVAARYTPANGASKLPPLYVATGRRFAACGDGPATLSGELKLARLRAATVYDVDVLVYDLGTGAASLEWTGRFTSASTGWAAFDGGAFVDVAGATPSWRVLTMAAQQDALGFDDPGNLSAAARGKSFDGMLGVDGEGHVVWYYHLAGFEAWDFLENGNVALVARRQGNLVVPAKRINGDDVDANANSQLQEVDVTGALVKQRASSCAGAPLGYNALSHECRADRATARARGGVEGGGAVDVLSARYGLRRIPNVTVVAKGLNGSDAPTTTKADTFFGTQIVAWDRETDDMAVLYDLFDLARPARDSVTFESSNWNAVRGGCSGNTTLTGVEYHHVSSVTVGVESNLLASSRTLNTIWSLAHDGSGARWTLSSSLEAGHCADCADAGGVWYAFEKDADRFYDPHGALQLPNGDVLVVDDGDDRPGCAVDRRGQCFSRVVCYALDAAAKVARVRWQFEWPYGFADADGAARSAMDVAARDAYSSVGGSVAPLANGNYLVAFTSVDARSADDARGSALAFEVDVAGGAAAVSRLAVPTPLADQDKQGAYRLVPWDSIAAETHVCPFDNS